MRSAIGTVDVFGVSLGGVVAQQLAHQAPTARSSARTRRDRAGARRRARLTAGALGVGHPAALLPARLLPPHRRGCLRGRGPPRPGRAAARLGGPVHASAERARLRRLRCTPSPAGRACPGCAACASRRSSWPATTIRSCPVVNGRILGRLIRDARVQVISGGGHLFVLEQPAAIAECVTDFLASPATSPDSVAPPDSDQAARAPR